MILFKFWILALVKLDGEYYLKIGDMMIYTTKVEGLPRHIEIAYKKTRLATTIGGSCRIGRQGVANVLSIDFRIPTMVFVEHFQIPLCLGFSISRDIRFGFGTGPMYELGIVRRYTSLSILFLRWSKMNYLGEIKDYISIGDKLTTKYKHPPYKNIEIQQINTASVLVLTDGQSVEIPIDELCYYSKI
jgi:hypothetical protein